MKLRASICFLACITCALLRSQDPAMPRYRVTTVPGQFLFLEFPITVERMFGRHTVGFTGAYRPDLIDKSNVPGRGAYHLQNYWNFGYRNVTGGVLHKYYLHDRFGLHFETSLLYRHWWFDRKQISYKGGDEPFNGLRSEEQKVLILKMMIGKSIIWKRKHGPARVLEYFVGPSIRLKQLDFTAHEGTVDGVVVEGLQQRREFWLPGLQLGVRYGIGLGR